MILLLDSDKITKQAAEILAKQRGEPEPCSFHYIDLDLDKDPSQEEIDEAIDNIKVNPAIKTTQDKTLTLIDLMADGMHQNLEAPYLLADDLKDMSPTIKNIELIISDVDVNKTLYFYASNLYDALYNRGKDVTIIASSLPVFESRNRGEGYTATCIIPPGLPEAEEEAFPKDWRIYKVRGDTVLKGKIKSFYKDFNYQTFLKLPEKQLLWHGENLSTWLYQNERIMDIYKNYMPHKGDNPEEVKKKREASHKHRLELIEKYSSKDSEHSFKKARMNDSKQASTSSNEASSISNSPSLPSLLPLLSSAPFASGESHSSSPNIKAIQPKVTLFYSSPLLAGQHSDSLKEKKTSSSETDSQHKDNETRPIIK